MSVVLPSNASAPNSNVELPVTRVWLIANPVGGGGKAPALVKPLMKMLAKRFSDFKPAMGADGEPLLENCLTEGDIASRRETCAALFTAGVEEGIILAADVARQIAHLPVEEISRCYVIPVGGDGTLSEVVHGLSTTILKDAGLTSAHLPNIVYLAAGTGADFARLGHCCKTPQEVMQVINAAAFVDPSRDAVDGTDESICGGRRVDVGSVTHLNTGAVRYFTNEASVGLSNAVVLSVMDFKKKRCISCLGGAAVFFAASAYELFKMKAHRFRMRKLPVLSGNTSAAEDTKPDGCLADAGTSKTPIPGDLENSASSGPAPAEVQKKQWEEGDWVYLDSTALVFGNGQYFGGGMRICPHGDPCDQQLAIASWGETVVGYALGVPGIYNGNATTKWKTSRMFSGSRVLIELAPVEEKTAKKSKKGKKGSDSPAEATPSPTEPPPHAFMETDGEPIGSLPAIVEISHQITFLMPLPREDPKNARKKR